MIYYPTYSVDETNSALYQNHKKNDLPSEPTTSTRKPSSYFDDLAKIKQIIDNTIPSGIGYMITLLFFMNCVLPIIISAAIDYLNQSNSEKENDKTIIYINALTVLMALISEQIRVNANLYIGSMTQNRVLKNLNQRIYGTDSLNAAIKLRRCIKEFQIDGGIPAAMRSYVESSIAQFVGFSFGPMGNFFEIFCTSVMLYRTSKNYSTPAINLTICTFTAGIIKYLTLVRNEERSKDKKNEEKQKNISKNIESTDNIATIITASRQLSQLADEQLAIKTSEVWKQLTSTSARDILLEMTRHIIRGMNAYFMSGQNQKIIETCSLQGVTILGSSRRLVEQLFKDRKEFRKGLDGLLNILRGIKNYEDFHLSRKENFPTNYDQHLQNNIMVHLIECNFVSFNEEALKFMENFEDQRFMKPYQAALNIKRLCNIYQSGFSLKKGKTYKLTALSGAGKTSFFFGLAGYNPLISGKLFYGCKQDEVCFIHGHNLDMLEDCSFIDLLLFPRFMTKKEGDGGVDLNSAERAETKKRLLDLLKTFSLLDKLPKDKSGLPSVTEPGNTGAWSELSAGEVTRVLVIRILMTKILPKVLVLDEVIGNLEADMEKIVWKTLKEELPADAVVIFVKHAEDEEAQMETVGYHQVIEFDPDNKSFKMTAAQNYVLFAQSKKSTASENLLDLRY